MIVNIKRVVALTLGILLMSVFAGCNAKKPGSTDRLILNNTDKAKQELAKDAPKKTVALVMKTLTNPFFIDMERGARKAETELGISLIVRTGAQETSIEQQISIVEELIKKKVDAIVIAPGHSRDLIPVLKRAQDAKIPIVNIDNRLDPEVSKQMGLINVPFISVDNEEGAYKSARHISDKILKPTEVAVLEGMLGAKNSEQRVAGAIKAFKENKNVKIVAVETANWKIDEAFKITSELFKKHPGIGAIFCANDMMALGAIEYLSKAGIKGVLVAGFDALEEAKEAIKAGKMQVTINQQADIQGYTGVVYAMKLIKVESVPYETMIPVLVEADFYKK